MYKFDKYDGAAYYSLFKPWFYVFNDPRSFTVTCFILEKELRKDTASWFEEK